MNASLILLPVTLIVVSTINFSQSNITYDAGSSLEIQTDADVCADAVIINGVYNGGGTICRGPLPVMLLSFSAAALKNNVKLNWITGNEMNNSGFDLERKETTKEKTWQKIGFVRGYGTTAEQKHYEFEDKKLTTGSYFYRLKQIDFNGNFEYFELSSEVLVKSPLEFRVSQNYPNPSNPNSKIDFEIPFEGWVNLRIYNLLGQQVKELVNGNRNADYYTVEFDGSNFASGIYFYITSVEGSGQKFTNTMKMVILK